MSETIEKSLGKRMGESSFQKKGREYCIGVEAICVPKNVMVQKQKKLLILLSKPVKVFKIIGNDFEFFYKLTTCLQRVFKCSPRVTDLFQRSLNLANKSHLDNYKLIKLTDKRFKCRRRESNSHEVALTGF